MEKGNTRQKKLASLLFIRTLQHGKEDHYLMARCGYRLANLYIRLKEPQKAQWAGVIHTAYTRHGRRPFFNSKVDYSPFQEKKA